MMPIWTWRVGDYVCCCDDRHRTIAEICEETGDLTMSDGHTCDPMLCGVEYVRLDGSCHDYREEVQR